MRLLFSRSASPHHGFAAYYTFLEKVRAAPLNSEPLIRAALKLDAP